MTYSTILVNLEAGCSNKHLLEAANDVADRFQAAVVGSAACMSVQMFYADAYSVGDIFEQDRKEIALELARAEAEFRDAMGNARIHEWRSSVADLSLAGHLASQASRADLVLVSAAPAGVTNAARQVDIGDLIMQAGRPVLLVAPAPVPVRMERVLVAWKNTTEARRAVASAIPLLKRANQVDLAEVTDRNDLGAARSRLGEVAAWLAGHGVKADIHARECYENDAAGVTALADELESDIVVAGAYGHSRVKEWALGGVTRTLIRHTSRPSLVSH